MRKVEIRPYQINLTSLPGRANHQSKQHSLNACEIRNSRTVQI
jgi:hypothetical protein